MTVSLKARILSCLCFCPRFRNRDDEVPPPREVEAPSLISTTGSKTEQSRKASSRSLNNKAGFAKEALPEGMPDQLEASSPTSLVVSSKLAAGELTSRIPSIKASYPSWHKSANSSLAPSKPSSADLSAASTISAEPSDTPHMPEGATLSKMSFLIPAPTLPVSTSATSAAGSVSSSVDGAPEMFIIRDLDSGKQYDIPQEFTIRDLTTGQVYALDAERSSPSAPEAAAPHLTNITSGHKIALDDFDGVLGQDNIFSSKSSDARTAGKSADTTDAHLIAPAASVQTYSQILSSPTLNASDTFPNKPAGINSHKDTIRAVTKRDSSSSHDSPNDNRPHNCRSATATPAADSTVVGACPDMCYWKEPPPPPRPQTFQEKMLKFIMTQGKRLMEEEEKKRNYAPAVPVAAGTACVPN